MTNHVQILLYTSYLHIIGGIETFVMNWIELMSPYYSIGVAVDQLPDEMAERISAKVPLFTNRRPVACDTLIMIRVMDDIPLYVKYRKSVRMCHACKSEPSWFIKEDCDNVIHVSKASKSTFKSSGDVIYNPVIKTKEKTLLLVSATRIPATDKGLNASRMLLLARMLRDAGIRFLWLNFSDAPLYDAPKGFLNVGSFQDLQPFIARADYLVQLSDQEGFGYSVAEALVNGTAVICTPFATTKELGVIDGVNGYIVPYELDFDVTKLLNVPKFDYSYDNDKIIKAWKKIIGPAKKTAEFVRVEVITEYFDNELSQLMRTGDVCFMTADRAKVVEDAGYIKLLGG